MLTTASVGLSQEFASELNKVECVEELMAENDKTANQPLIDIFLNPSEEKKKKLLIDSIENKSQNFFKTADMSKLYPRLFRLLWHATLPCSEMPNLSKEHMVKSCHLVGLKLDCRKLFTKVPTDHGMCCSLNYEEAIKQSPYSQLVLEMQNATEYADKDEEFPERIKVAAAVGIKNGIQLTLDLHSNTESLGSVSEDFAAFKVFIGQPLLRFFSQPYP